MLDTYLWGKVDRISPEAPVPVVALQSRENRLGGAANVALNIQALGAIPVLCSVIGNDNQGDIFLELLLNKGLSTEGILKSKERITTTKFRIIGNNAQMLRVDEEIINDLSESDEHLFIKHVNQLISTEKPDVLIFQDYNKGILTEHVISAITSLCIENQIPTCADPKKKNFSSYRNITLFKPNLKELKDGLKTDLNVNDLQGLDKAVMHFQETQNIDLLMVTLSESGVLIRKKGQAESVQIIPAHKRMIADVSGAGDTVISVASLCLALKCPADQIAVVANLAGGLVCEQVGVVPVNKVKLLSEVTKLL